MDCARAASEMAAALIVFSHIRNTGNTGDLASCPAEYFDFPEHRVQNYDEPLGDCDTVIYGGGTMNNWLQGRPLSSATSIAWGIGSSRHGETEPWPDPHGFALVGVREWSEDREWAGLWAPCASCMSPLFDKPGPRTRQAVLFVNASPGIRDRYPIAVGGLPLMGNDRPFAEIVASLASAAVVVTDSYHGCWFAQMLGRKVVCVPYSSKFYGFKYSVQYSDNRGLDWRARAEEALVYPDALDECRAASRAFYKRVLETLGRRRAA